MQLQELARGVNRALNVTVTALEVGVTVRATQNKKKKEAVMTEMWKMKKLDIKKLKVAFDNA